MGGEFTENSPPRWDPKTGFDNRSHMDSMAQGVAHGSGLCDKGGNTGSCHLEQSDI